MCNTTDMRSISFLFNVYERVPMHCQIRYRCLKFKKKETDIKLCGNSIIFQEVESKNKKSFQKINIRNKPMIILLLYFFFKISFAHGIFFSFFCKFVSHIYQYTNIILIITNMSCFCYLKNINSHVSLQLHKYLSLI